MAMDEPPIIIHNREQLLDTLSEAGFVLSDHRKPGYGIFLASVST